MQSFPPFAMTHLEKIGDACRAARVSAGHKQQLIADIAGVDKATVSRFENGKSNNALLYSIYLYLYMQGRHELIPAIDDIGKVKEEDHGRILG